MYSACVYIIVPCILSTHVLYLTIQILMKYRTGWAISKHSYPFTFEDNKITGKLRDERGNGWHAAINGPTEVSKLPASNVR